VWKFQDFSFTEILREINFGEARNSKIAVFAILRAVKNSSKFKFRASECVKMANFALLESPN